MVPETEMSISRTMIRSAMKSATMAFSVKLKVTSESVPMMISTPFLAIGATSTPWIAASGR